jgi:cyclic pyranopterin phosphate synthase
MDHHVAFIPRHQLLTLEELALIAQAFVELGVVKIRVTGGEPLIRNNVLQLFRNLGQLEGLQELAMTTNGSRLTQMAKPLREFGVRAVNISLDSLNPHRFRYITQYGELPVVLRGIETVLQVGFERVKLNTVILKGINHDEIVDLVKFAIQSEIDISFIEEMPLGVIDHHDRAQAYYSSDQIRCDLEQHFELIPTTESSGGPSQYYRVAHAKTRVGFISPHSHNFCHNCNRVRVTTHGQLFLCLGQEDAADLRSLLRSYPNEIELLKQAITQAIAHKPQGHDFDLQKPSILRYMNITGG